MVLSLVEQISRVEAVRNEDGWNLPEFLEGSFVVVGQFF